MLAPGSESYAVKVSSDHLTCQWLDDGNALTVDELLEDQGVRRSGTPGEIGFAARLKQRTPDILPPSTSMSHPLHDVRHRFRLHIDTIVKIGNSHHLYEVTALSAGCMCKPFRPDRTEYPDA